MAPQTSALAHHGPGAFLVAALRSRRGKLGLGTLALLALLLLKRIRDSPRNVRWLEGRPFLGMLVEILRGLRDRTLLDTYVDWTQQLGMTFAYRVPGKVFVATVDPKNIEHMLKTNFDNYIKGHIFADPFTDLLGEGIFNADGEVWHVQRKTASRMFTKKQFETHIWSTLSRNTAKVSAILDKTAGKSFDMFNLMNRFTLDTIGEIGFSKDIGSLEDPSSPFLASFDLVQQILIKRFWVNPVWKLMRAMGLGWEPLLHKHLQLLDDYSRGIVRDLKKKSEVGEDHSFVGLFMKESLARKGDEAQQETFMRDMVLNFLIAGRDTTAQCISWTFYELMQRPDVVVKVREEVQAVCGDGPVTFEHTKHLRYVQAVLDEGLRLHPSVPLDGKLAIDRDVLPDGTVVPAGCILQFMPYAQGRCKQIWGEDAGAFRPERWLEMESRPSSFVFSAFNAGPRECLGKRLAEMEMTVLVASILRDFELTLDCHPKDVTYDAQITLGMSGLPVTARRVRETRVGDGHLSAPLQVNEGTVVAAAAA